MATPFDPKPPLFPWYPPLAPPKPAAPCTSLPPLKLGDIFADLLKPVRFRIFVSYQHSSDQYYYDQFSKLFHDDYETIFDNSLPRKIESDDPDYVIQRIRNDFITGTSCTVVLVGPTTYQRKYVDWEIKATLDKEHGLIGIQLPNVVAAANGRITAPDRLSKNVDSGYALWQGFTWQGLIQNPSMLRNLIQQANNRDKSLIRNPWEIKKQNG